MEYKDPDPSQFLKWSEAKRLRENPNRGFATGFDTETEEEKKKREKRKERFKRKKDGTEDDDDMGSGSGAADGSSVDPDAPSWSSRKPSVEPREAWANFHTVKRFRVDAFEGRDDLEKDKIRERESEEKQRREEREREREGEEEEGAEEGEENKEEGKEVRASWRIESLTLI